MFQSEQWTHWSKTPRETFQRTVKSLKHCHWNRLEQLKPIKLEEQLKVLKRFENLKVVEFWYFRKSFCHNLRTPHTVFNGSIRLRSRVLIVSATKVSNTSLDFPRSWNLGWKSSMIQQKQSRLRGYYEGMWNPNYNIPRLISRQSQEFLGLRK